MHPELFEGRKHYESAALHIYEGIQAKGPMCHTCIASQCKRYDDLATNTQYRAGIQGLGLAKLDL